MSSQYRKFHHSHSVRKSRRLRIGNELGTSQARRGLRFESLERRCMLAADFVSDLVGHWQLDETTIGQSVIDSSSSANSGTHTNIASPNGPSLDAVIGGRSLSLDGADDYVAIGPAPVSLWTAASSRSRSGSIPTRRTAGTTAFSGTNRRRRLAAIQVSMWWDRIGFTEALVMGPHGAVSPPKVF